MFSFSMDRHVPYDVRGKQLADQNIGEDHDLAEHLRQNGDYREDEQYFRAENEKPRSLQEAIEFVQGIFFHPPTRVWLDGDPIEVTDDDLAGTRKPGA